MEKLSIGQMAKLNQTPLQALRLTSWICLNPLKSMKKQAIVTMM